MNPAPVGRILLLQEVGRGAPIGQAANVTSRRHQACRRRRLRHGRRPEFVRRLLSRLNDGRLKGLRRYRRTSPRSWLAPGPPSK